MSGSLERAASMPITVRGLRVDPRRVTVEEPLEGARHGAHPMATLQAIVPLLGLDPPDLQLGRSAEEEEGLVIAARLPAAIALVHAALEDHPEHPYPHSRRYGERYLTLMNGVKPSHDEVEVFECMQTLQLDHGFNASTFTARVVTSTLAPTSSALSAAMGALFGPLHGAADQGALEMALEVEEAEVAGDFVAHCLQTGRKVLGMGHREYRVVDPRAKIMKAMARKIALRPEHQRLFQTLSAVEAAFVSSVGSSRGSGESAFAASVAPPPTRRAAPGRSTLRRW